VREKVKAAQFVHTGSARGEQLAMGDRVITRQALFDTSDRRIGTLVTDWVNTGATAEVFKAQLHCVSTYRLKDGQVVSAGAVRLADGPGNRFPIVGGAGAYRGASGEITAGAPVKGYQGVDVLHFDG
jgi:Allene oxide cyclase barrel like domain